MSSDNWHDVKQTLAVLTSLEGLARRNYLKHVKRKSPKIAKEVKELLIAAMAAKEDSFLGRPAVQTDQEDSEELN